MKTLEKVTTTKGCYSLVLKVIEINGEIRTLVSIECPDHSMHVSIDKEDMRRIALLFQDNANLPLDNLYPNGIIEL